VLPAAPFVYAGKFPVDVAAGDVTGDGVPDVSVANATGGYVTLLPGDGMGGLVNPQRRAYGGYGDSAAVADFNGDGRPDFATARPSGDSAGSAYITGDATSPYNFPTTPGALQTTFGGGPWDAFVVKLNPTGTGLVFGTYLGGSNDETGWGIAVDAAGNAYLVGHTFSSNFPTTADALKRRNRNGVRDGFVTKFAEV
jgi:hypothetical protein